MPDEPTKDLNVKGIPRSTYERWQEAAQREGRSLSNWLQLELSNAAERVFAVHDARQLKKGGE